MTSGLVTATRVRPPRPARWAVIPGRVARHLQSDRGQRVEREAAFGSVLRMLAASLRAGLSLEVALAQAGKRTRHTDVARAVHAASARLRAGMSTRASLEYLVRELDVEGVELFAKLVELQAAAGGDPGTACHRLAHVLHERSRLRNEALSATALARFASKAVIAMPLVAGVGWLMVGGSGASSLLAGGGWLLLLPTVLLLIAGGVGIRVIALRSIDSFSSTTKVPARRAQSLLSRVAGTGSDTFVRVRLGVFCVTPLVACTMASGGGLFAWGATSVAALAAWRYPQARRHAERVATEAVITAGLPELLELTVAFLGAGASPREALLGAIDHGRMALASELGSVAAGVRLGRSPAAAFSVHRLAGHSHALDTWAFSLTDGDRLGAPAVAVLESLLTDARSVLREQFRQRAATSGPRMQLVTVLVIVPAILWAVISLTGLGLARQLTSSGLL